MAELLTRSHNEGEQASSGENIGGKGAIDRGREGEGTRCADRQCSNARTFIPSRGCQTDLI